MPKLQERETTMQATTRRLAALGLCGVLTMTGCSKIAEKAIEKASGCKKLHVSDKSASGECNGEKFNANSKGGSITDKNGNTTSYGTSGGLPKGWPADLTPPKGTTITDGSTSTTNGQTDLTVTAQVPGPPDQVRQGLVNQLKGAGYTVSTDSFDAASKGGAINATKGTTTVNAGYIDGSEVGASGKTSVTFSVQLGAS
ncbi:MAG TPA: hypothetical protein VGM93_01580 [Acidimicrobiales bacterium]